MYICSMKKSYPWYARMYIMMIVRTYKRPLLLTSIYVSTYKVQFNTYQNNKVKIVWSVYEGPCSTNQRMEA